MGTYALKIVPVGNNSKWLERMLHEVRLLENFRHENVVNYKHTWIEIFQPSAFGIPVPCLFILMEHADAGNLEDFVERHYPRYSSCNEILPFRFSPFHFEREPYSVKVKNLALQICRGIQHLHDMKIIHHDLKPQNILLKKSGTGYCALISDFGECEFVHSVGSRIRTGATGTLEYMAPELLRTDKYGKYLSGYSESSDIWSFGMVLFNMCYGTLPFEAESLEDSDAVAKEIMHLNGVKISFPSNPSMEPFNQIICNCLQQNPKARPTIDQILGQIAAIELLEEKKRQQQQPKLNKYSRSILFLTLVVSSVQLFWMLIRCRHFWRTSLPFTIIWMQFLECWCCGWCFSLSNKRFEIVQLMEMQIETIENDLLAAPKECHNFTRKAAIHQH